MTRRSAQRGFFTVPGGMGLIGPAGGSGAATDPSFASVKLLLHFDAGNGSTTITDSSNPSPGGPATCTANNGAACSTTQSKFGASALLLDGTNDYISTNRGSGTSGQFTLEAWIRPTGAQTGRIIGAQDSSFTNPVIFLRVNSNGSLQLFLRDSSGGGVLNISSSAGLVAMDDSAWHHVAATRDGSSNVNIWLDGSSVASGTSGTDPTSIPRGYDIGSQYGLAEFFKGYIDDVRVTEGVCRYTSTFTPPAGAFPNS